MDRTGRRTAPPLGGGWLRLHRRRRPLCLIILHAGPAGRFALRSTAAQGRDGRLAPVLPEWSDHRLHLPRKKAAGRIRPGCRRSAPSSDRMQVRTGHAEDVLAVTLLRFSW